MDLRALIFALTRRLAVVLLLAVAASGAGSPPASAQGLHGAVIPDDAIEAAAPDPALAAALFHPTADTVICTASGGNVDPAIFAAAVQEHA